MTRSVQWKSVEDGLPPLEERVLLARVKAAPEEGLTCCTDCGMRTEDGWRSDTEGIVEGVTHWTNLPETPIPAIMEGVLETLRQIVRDIC